MKALVTYYSQTDNTETLARAIYDAVYLEKALLPIKDVSDVQGYDVIFIGFPVHSHSVPPGVIPFFKRLPDGQKIALFCTHGSLRGGQLPRQALEHGASLAARAKVLGTFGVRGKVDPTVLDSLMQKAEHRSWALEAQGAADHPNAADLADARAFAREIQAKLVR